MSTRRLIAILAMGSWLSLACSCTPGPVERAITDAQPRSEHHANRWLAQLLPMLQEKVDQATGLATAMGRRRVDGWIDGVEPAWRERLHLLFPPLSICERAGKSRESLIRLIGVNDSESIDGWK